MRRLYLCHTITCRLSITPTCVYRVWFTHHLLIHVAFCLIDFVDSDGLDASGLMSVNIGRGWMVGCGLSMFVSFYITQQKMAADGVMPFCRSIGASSTEELMFSYSWKVQEDTIRTLAKAVWASGVGVWIDVVKLCPGDEIRPVVRTMVRQVQRCIVFLSSEYAKSPNCCVEFWEAVQLPEKLIICTLDAVPDSVMDWLHGLGVKTVTGIDGLIPLLHDMYTNLALSPRVHQSLLLHIC